MERISHRRWIPYALLAAYGIFLIVTLPDYGVTWDEVGWFQYGYAQWLWIVRGAGESLKDPYDYFYYGSLPSLIAAGSHYLFHTILQWVSSDTGYHLANIGFAFLLALGIAVWGKPVLGILGASLALFIWMLLPRLWPDAHYNISDLPGAAGYFWGAWAAWRIFQIARPRLTDYLLCGGLLGIAYSLRAPNVYFLALALALWFAACRWLLKISQPALTVWGVFVALAVFFCTVKLANPHLWNASVLRQVLWVNPNAYLYSGLGKEDLWFNGHYYQAGSAPIYYAPWFWLISTPLWILVFWALGVWKIVRGGAQASPHLLLWFILWATALSKHLLGSGNYDGVRHFLESYAPMSLLAAQGALLLFEQISGLTAWQRKWAGAVLCLPIIATLYTGWRIHPYESGYFNILAGSDSNAWKKYEVEYWGQSFLPASNWVRKHIDPNTRVYVPDGAHIARYYLDPPFAVSTMKPYWDFPDRKSYTEGLNSFLAKAPSGSVLLKLNRIRLYHGDLGFGCPVGWQAAHRVGPDTRLPPMLMICQK